MFLNILILYLTFYKNNYLDYNFNERLNITLYEESNKKFNERFNERFKVCGSYCGPGWCNNMWIDENICDASIKPEYHNLTGYSCEDSCCRLHDICCGQEKSKQNNCNKEIVKCLSYCNQMSITCTIDKIPVIPFIVKTAMNIIEDWCCGTPC